MTEPMSDQNRPMALKAKSVQGCVSLCICPDLLVSSLGEKYVLHAMSSSISSVLYKAPSRVHVCICVKRCLSVNHKGSCAASYFVHTVLQLPPCCMCTRIEHERRLRM